MALVRWDPWGEQLRMARDLDRIFGRLGQQGTAGESVAWMPKIDVKRSGDDVMVRAELPGVKPEDVDIELSDNVLTISGERRQEQEREDEGYLIRESSFGSFERSLSVPESVDPSTITANFNDGVLEVTVPKALQQTRPQTTRIPIGGQTQMQMGAGQQGQQMQGQMQGQQTQGQRMGMSEQGMTQADTQTGRQQREGEKVGSGSSGTEGGSQM